MLGWAGLGGPGRGCRCLGLIFPGLGSGPLHWGSGPPLNPCMAVFNISTRRAVLFCKASDICQLISLASKFLSTQHYQSIISHFGNLLECYQ